MAQADYTRISSNIAALNTLNSLRNINAQMGKAQLRLATGKRINEAADDPAGLTIALKMNARNEGLKVALNNIADSKNMLAVAESGLQSISNILTEMKSKATSAASDTLGTEERAAIQSQLQSLARQINDIVDETEWNGTLLLDGTVNKSLQTGAGGSDTTAWTLSQDHDSVQLGVASGSATGALVYSSGSTYQLNQGGQTGYDTTVIMDAFGANSTHGVVETLDSFDGLSELESGTYKFTLATEKASLATQAYAVASNGPTALGTFTGIAGGNATYELDSGMYTFEITGHSGATIDYTITNNSESTPTITRQSLNIDGGGTTLLDSNGNQLGIQIGSASGIATGTTFTFEYIQEGYIKMNLYKVSGATEEVVAADANGTDDTGVDTRKADFYVDVSTTTAVNAGYNTGLGLKVYLQGAWATMDAGDSATFTYTQAGDVSVDVSSSSLASAYMDDVDAAITTVTDSLNSIGSLVARLNAKEFAVGSAQVNTEAAYNRIMNADMAFEQVEASKYMILQQTAVAMLAQSNMAPQGILSLFQ